MSNLGDIVQEIRKLVEGGIALKDGDIQIGAVELKDGDSDTRADIESDGNKNSLFIQKNPNTTDDIGFEDDSFVSGDTDPAVLDVNATLGKNSKNGYLICDGLGSIGVSISADGVTSGAFSTMKKNEIMTFKDESIDTIKIVRLGSDTAYRVKVA